ncbi:MAG: hypothetical protein IT430_03715 [Phycisphaerales bacterium]|nr:hypothetical protein [Phycisphaerales bacterium]
MGTYPVSPREDFLAWCNAHTQTFIDHAAAIGATPAQTAGFKVATENAANALTDLDIARGAAESATANTNLKFAELRKKAAEMVRSIRTFAENTGNPGVYVIANIPAPQPPQPAPPPAQPTDLTVSLDPTSGAPVLVWKASNPAGTQGTSYIIRRRTAVAADFEFVGVTGAKKFTDDSFFAGPDMVQYTVQGQRSDVAGPVSPIFTINFGRVGGGGGGGMGIVSTMLEGAPEVRVAA